MQCHKYGILNDILFHRCMGQHLAHTVISLFDRGIGISLFLLHVGYHELDIIRRQLLKLNHPQSRDNVISDGLFDSVVAAVLDTSLFIQLPDGNSALMLVCARLRHVAGTQWGSKKYMNMKHLEAMEQETLVG